MTVLNTDVAANATRIMTQIYKKRYGKWKYRVTGEGRLYARKTPEHGCSTDVELFAAMSELGVESMTQWLLHLSLGRCCAFFRKRSIISPRDLLLLSPEDLASTFSDLEAFTENLDRTEAQLLGTGGSDALVGASRGSSRAGGARHQAVRMPDDDGDSSDDENALLFNSKSANNDEEVLTDAMKLQEELKHLRNLLGLDVENGGVGRSFDQRSEFLVCERRFEGSQTHLRLPNGGWVVEKSPRTLEPLATCVKTVGGKFYPPLSNILNPDVDDKEHAFLPIIDYKQMNCLGLPLKDDTFDGVIIKGLIDAMLCNGSKGRNDVLLLLGETYRVLKPTGKFLIVSHGGEHPNAASRIQLFKEDIGTFKWNVETHPLSKPASPGQFHMAYVLTPQPVKPGETWDAEEAQQAVVN